jgi:hypothetical protein
MGRYFSLSTGEKVRVRTWPVILTPSAAFGAPYNDYRIFHKKAQGWNDLGRKRIEGGLTFGNYCR